MPFGQALRGALVALFCTVVPSLLAAQVDPQAFPQLERQVLPILGKYCLTCHGAAMQMGKLDLRALAAMTHRGEQGPALVKGSAGMSRRVQRIADKSMPPTDGKVTDNGARIIRDWIDGGAKTAEAIESSRGKAESTHWAFQPPVRPAVPKVTSLGWQQNPIDAFVLARLEKASLKPPTQAGKRMLLPRVYLELIELLPKMEEQQAFLSDRSPNAWRYRDYVINALYQDKGFDRFVTEPLAGDEVVGANAEIQIAPTFLRLGTHDDEPAEPQWDRYDQLDDVLGTTAASFLGLTLRCARCHDHKFEPLNRVLPDAGGV